MCFLTVSSRLCLETNPHSTLRTPFAGHCLGALWGGKPCPAELSKGVNRVLRTLSGDPPLPILQTPSAGHCLDTHGCLFLASRFSIFFSVSRSFWSPMYRMSRPQKHPRVDPRKKTISMPNSRVQNLDTEKKISTPKRRLRPPRTHKKDILMPKKRRTLI